MLARKIQYEQYNYSDYAYQEEVLPQVHSAPRSARATALRTKVFAIVAMLLLFAFYMVMRADTERKNGNILVQMKTQEAELVKNIEYSKVNIAKAKAPERITALAAGIGMVTADKNVYVSAVQPKQKQQTINEKGNSEFSLAWSKSKLKTIIN